MQGAVGSQVTITISLNPPVPYNSLEEIRLGFTASGNQIVEAEILDGQVSGDPVTQFQIIGVVPEGAITGPMTVLVGVTGQQQYLAAESPTPFQVGGGGVTPPPTAASMEGYDFYFNTPDGKGISAKVDEARADADPISQLRLTAKVPEGAITGKLAVVIYIRGVAQPLVAESPTPFQVGGGITPPPTGTRGDLTGDGKVNVADATLALQIAVGNANPTPTQSAAGDVVNTGDGIKIADATKILQVAVGNGSF
jgi:hypothetical protein